MKEWHVNAVHLNVVLSENSLPGFIRFLDGFHGLCLADGHQARLHDHANDLNVVDHKQRPREGL
jgi:hypothetical protein